MTAKQYETILVEKQDGITWVTFNRPDKRNAMSPQMHLDMDDVLDELTADDATQVLVITGAGESFSSGQDIRLYFRGTETDPMMRAKARRASNQWRWQKLSTFPKPTIAMVNVSWNVAQVMNYRDALYYAMTGDTFDGKKAREIGFVNMHVPRAKLKEETIKFAKKLMEKSPAALRYTKEAIRAVRFMNEPQAQDYLNAKSDALKFNDKEGSRQEGMRQFLDEKSYRPGFEHFKRKKVAAK